MPGEWREWEEGMGGGDGRREWEGQGTDMQSRKCIMMEDLRLR